MIVGDQKVVSDSIIKLTNIGLQKKKLTPFSTVHIFIEGRKERKDP